MTPPNPAPVLECLDGFRRSKTLFAALSLGIFDRLADGPRTAAELAGPMHADPSAVERLLQACVSLGFLEPRGEGFGNSATASVYLVHGSPDSLAGYIQYSNDFLYPMWGHLEDAVREGTHRWQQTFQLSAGALFDRFFHTDDAMRTFLMGMHGFGMLSSPAVVRAFDLSRFERMVDLGGATGHLVAAACARYPRLHGILFELPRVVEFAETMLAGSEVRGRVRCVAGDFFEDSLPLSDLYALGRILHDWAPDRIRRLLARILEQLPDGGALLLAEKLLDDDRLGPATVHLQSLNMLVVTEGRERSLPEYRELLMEAGFSSVEGVRTGKPLDAILAVK